MRKLFPELPRGPPTRKPQCFAIATYASSHPSPAEWRPVEIDPSASSISLPGAGADVCTRKARHPRSSIKISFRFRLRRHWRDSGTLSRITAFGPKLRLNAVAARATGPRIPRTFDQCQEMRGTLDGYGSGRHRDNRRHFHNSTTPPPGLA
jgi:hypothetical protein